MSEQIDNAFFERADRFIALANNELGGDTKGKVSASFMFGAARFAAWLSAGNYRSGEHLGTAKDQTLDYFTQQFRAMLEEHLDDYVENFDKYMYGKTDQE